MPLHSGTLRASLCAFFAFAISTAAVAQAPAAPPTKPPAEAFGQLAAVSQPQISPDGKYFATIQQLNAKPAVFIYVIGAPISKTNPAIFQDDKWTVSSIGWAKNDRLLLRVIQSKTIAENAETYTLSRGLLINPEAKEPKRFDIGDIIDFNTADPDTVIAEQATIGRTVQTDRPFRRTDVVKANVRTGKTEILYQGTEDTTGWIADGNGNIVARIDMNDKPRQEILYLRKGNEWVKTLSTDIDMANPQDSYHGVSEDGKSIIITAQDKRGMYVLESYDMATGQRSPLFAAPENDVAGAMQDRWTKRIVGAAYLDDQVRYVIFDPNRAALQTALEKAFPGMVVRTVSKDLSSNRLILDVSDARHPTTYYFFDRTTHQVAPIVASYPGLSPEDLGEVKAYPYKARDGWDIHSYLTLPPGKAPKNLPLIVMPHGGPSAFRDYIYFDWWAQFLANRGYAVLQMNFRGSPGYGTAFLHGGTGEWGRKMQNDITDGAKKAIADGIADPKRVCIVGWSYGGYAAMAGATFTPDLYACAFAGAGISDVPALVISGRTKSGKSDYSFENLTALVGDIYDEAHLKDVSPKYHAEQVRAPMLLMHADGDSNVDISQSEMEEKALLKAGKKVKFIRVTGGEDHHLKFATTRILLLKELEKFLKENIGD